MATGGRGAGRSAEASQRPMGGPVWPVGVGGQGCLVGTNRRLRASPDTRRCRRRSTPPPRTPRHTPPTRAVLLDHGGQCDDRDVGTGRDPAALVPAGLGSMLACGCAQGHACRRAAAQRSRVLVCGCAQRSRVPACGCAQRSRVPACGCAEVTRCRRGCTGPGAHRRPDALCCGSGSCSARTRRRCRSRTASRR